MNEGLIYEYAKLSVRLTFLHDSLLVVIPETSRKLVVVHGGSVLLDAPAPCHFFRFYQLELHPSTRPSYAGTKQKFVQETTTTVNEF